MWFLQNGVINVLLQKCFGLAFDGINLNLQQIIVDLGIVLIKLVVDAPTDLIRGCLPNEQFTVMAIVIFYVIWKAKNSGEFGNEQENQYVLPK